MTLEKSSAESNAVLQERIPQIPPVIKPVGEYVARPLWSVMIPVYNCLRYLPEALQCVLSQDPGLEQMQIVVVDDCSTDGDVGALVQEIGKGRIKYFRQTENQGSLRNFETCLNLSTGHLIHILHGDDRVLPGFYTEIKDLFENFPTAGAAFTNVAYMTSESEILFAHSKLLSKPGIVQDFLVRNAQKLLVQPPAIVVKRAVYEQLGGFFAVHYGEDWEMWTRIAAHFPIAYSPQDLANYRYHVNESITQRSILSGQNVRDIIRIIDIMQSYLPAGDQVRIGKLARRDYALYCVGLSCSLYRTNRAAALRQVRGALQLSQDKEVYIVIVKRLINNEIVRKGIKKIIQKSRSIFNR